MQLYCQEELDIIFQELSHPSNSYISTFPWNNLTWQKKILTQTPWYDPKKLKTVLAQLVTMPALIHEDEVIYLRQSLLDAKNKRAFILQIGDCAEVFNDAQLKTTLEKVNFINLLAERIKKSTGLSVIKIGRLAGQYAKPRTHHHETQGSPILSYRGDIFNDSLLTPEARQVDSNRMLQAYHCSSIILQILRRYTQATVSKAIVNQLYVSHEALHLFYEQAMTRYCKYKAWYNSSTHFPWVGIRTARVDYAHIEYVAGILNPIAIKIGPQIENDEIIKIIHRINPRNEPNKLTLIHRFGVNDIQSLLPKLLASIRKEQLNVIWICDPMHGNTEMDISGFKVRKCEKIKAEISLAYQIHAKQNSHLSGIHLESTHENVHECLSINEKTLKVGRYKSLVDPRLNKEQTVEIIDHIISCLTTIKPKKEILVC